MKCHRKLHKLRTNNVTGFVFARLRGIIEPEPPDGYHLEYEGHSCRQKNFLPVVFASPRAPVRTTARRECSVAI